MAGAFGTAISRVDIGTSSDKSVADVHIGVDALIKADGTLSITAINHSDNGALQSRSKANADTGTFVATATASAEGSLHADATVRIDISLTAERGLYASDAMKNWFCKIGAPINLSEGDIPAEEIPAIAENATMLAQKWGLDEYTKEVIEDILRRCE